MKRIAVLITFHNRKNKTLACLKSLFNSFKSYQNEIELKIFLTDDGSSDNTAETIKKTFYKENIIIIAGTGSLFWAGGMRKCWLEAAKEKFDGFLLLNDDTLVYDNIFKELINTHTYCNNTYKQSGIYIGSTVSSVRSNEITYGGSIINNFWKQSTTRLIPNKVTPQLCDIGNANIMFVTFDVFHKLGVLCEKFKHGLADYDYTLIAKKKGIPVLITSNFCGVCENDHKSVHSKFEKLNLNKRIKFAYSPLGFDFSSYLLYNQRNFFYRVPFVFVIGWLRILFPSIFSENNHLILSKDSK